MMPVFTHHEQAGAFAAQAYARIRNNIGACFVTTGPGATNAITGLAAAWLDSVPCFYVSGQARVNQTTRHRAIRQLGTQELDIVDVVKSLTNYAVMLEDANDARYELEKAFYLATSGRPGPVWIDVPLDLQWAQIDPATMRSFTPPADAAKDRSDVPQSVTQVLSLLETAQRPLLVAGYGVVRAHAEKEFLRFAHESAIPFVTTWGACDIAPHSQEGYVGRPGLAGQRGANLAMQNCDVMLVIGSHLCIPVTGSVLKFFAPKARVVMVDIDPEELRDRSVPVHVPICADAKEFLSELLRQRRRQFGRDEWREMCLVYHRRYNAPPVASE